ncbi:M16 family metallopeptidase [Neisseria sp. Ec49-e6-T10]|uniref:M16 family metallopeptidase n=1 Tax=Neisseria sp. Ec49-e6-T10 TaxID=3140744 RepID=UPI003EBB403C
MRYKSIALLLFLSLGVSLSSAKTVSETLPNGLKVIIKEDNRAPVAVSQVWYRVGGVDEINGQTGLSHALEHMMFKGTKKVPAGQFSRKIAAMGGEDNAFTGNSQTVYYQRLAASKLPEALALEADRMVNLNFSDKDFANEMKVIREERRLRLDDQPIGLLYDALYTNAFVANPIRNPVIGWMDDLEHLQANQLRAWYKQWYAPNNATIIIVGDVKVDETLNTVKKLFGGLKAQPLPTRQLTKEPKQTGVKRVQISAPSELPLLALSYKVPRLEKVNDKEPYALSVLASILDGNEASRLSKNLIREKQVATSISVGYDDLNRGNSLFTIIAAPAQNVTVQDLEKHIKAQLADIAQNGVSESELSVIFNQIEAGDVYQKDSMFSQAMSMGYLEINGLNYQDEETMKKNELSVTANEVKKAAQSLIEDNLTVVTLKPLPLNNNAQAATSAQVVEGDHVR